VTQEPQTGSAATRRGVLAGVGLVGLASAITACGASGSSSTASGSSAAGALASTSQIPVGSGMIFTAEQVVVTQPAAGEFKAFSAVCTHRGCIVNQINDGTIDCPCHGSQYSIKTGAVVAGPAPRPLPARQIKVTGGSIFLE
jgi:nitrite reductase/ring-hydroxylating ferredoxin subunit